MANESTDHPPEDYDSTREYHGRYIDNTHTSCNPKGQYPARGTNWQKRHQTRIQNGRVAQEWNNIEFIVKIPGETINHELAAQSKFINNNLLWWMIVPSEFLIIHSPACLLNLE